MALLYTEEHASCFNYDGGTRPAIEYKNLHKEELWDTIILEHKIVLVAKGSIEISYSHGTIERLNKGKILLLPSGHEFSALALENTDITVFRLRAQAKLCECFSLKQLLQADNRAKEKKILSVDRSLKVDTINKDNLVIVADGSKYLQMNESLMAYAKLLNVQISNGLKCSNFFELKLTELYLIFRAYYTKEQLLHFFSPVIAQDAGFTAFISANCHRVKTVIELAKLSNYSLSVFERRFKLAFGISAGKWMKQNKAKAIFYEINSTDKTFKDISFCYGFSSPAHLSNFCKIQFGMPPGEIRQHKKKRIDNNKVDGKCENYEVFL